MDSIEAGEELALLVTTIPQVARHVGYEAAFREIDDVSITLYLI